MTDDFDNILEVLGSDSDGEASFMQLCDEANFLKKVIFLFTKFKKKLNIKIFFFQNPRVSAEQDGNFFFK